MYRGSAMTLGLLFAGLGVLGASHEAAGQASATVQLTDGTSLDNFNLAGNANWRTAERTIAADRGNGFLVTKNSYADFKLRAEVWVDDIANSGIFIRCDNPQQPGANTCYEINIFDTNPNPRNATGAIVGVAAPSEPTKIALNWAVVEIEARGPQMTVTINGKQTASARDEKHLRGRIAFQRNEGVVRWRKIEITPL